MSTTYQIQQLLEKATNGDPDFRIMFLQDVRRKATESLFALEDQTEARLVDQVLNMFNDSNSEVRSLAASTISILVAKVKEDRVQKIIEKLTVMTSAKDDALRDVASLGLKTVVKEIAPDSRLSVTACNKLAPKILVQLKNTSSSQDLLIQLIEVLGDIYARFETTIRANAEAQTEGLNGLTALLNDSRGAVRKRAIRALGNLVVCSGESIYTNLFQNNAMAALSNSSAPDQLKTAITLVATLASSAPKRTGKRVAEVLPPILKAAGSDEDEELKELALQAIETLLLKCPAETTPLIKEIISVAGDGIKHDPNYAVNGDDMDEDIANDEEADDEDAADEEDEFDEEYEDDDDVSWKIRRASVKVFQMAIQTRLDLLAYFYKSIAPILISRFAEREETVRLEVWSAYIALLKQTYVWGGNFSMSPLLSSTDDMSISRPESPATNQSLKRKRDASKQAEDSPITLLASQSAQVTKLITKQLMSTKSLSLRLAGFQILYNMVLVLQGGLETGLANIIPLIESIVKAGDHGTVSGAAGGSVTNLKIQIFSFLTLLFKAHQLQTLQPQLDKLVPLIVNSIGDKSPKISAAALAASTGLVKALSDPSSELQASSPSGAAYIKQVCTATVAGLGKANADQEVREAGIVCLGDILATSSQELGGEMQSGLQILKDRLRNENTRLISLITISKIANSDFSASENLGPFMQDIAFEVGDYLRKSNRPVQAASFACLEAILKRSGQNLPLDGCQALVNNLQPSIANPDIHLSRSLNCLSTLLHTQPGTLSTVQEQIMPALFSLISASSQITASASDSLLKFFSAYVHAGGDGSELVKELQKVAIESGGRLQVSVTVSRGVASIHHCVADIDQKGASSIVEAFSTLATSTKSDAVQLSLSFLVLGEIGRTWDLSAQKNVFNKAVSHLGSQHDEVRSAAAFAIGNMTAGSPAAFASTVLQEIEKSGNDDRRMHLLLGSIKEILSHSSSTVLTDLSKTLWAPLFQLCENASIQQKAAVDASSASGSSAKAGDEARLDGTRNIAAECLGKITLTNPTVYLTQLQSRLSSPSAGTRAAVITAIRFTFTDASSAYDGLLAPLIVQFLSLMHDEDLTVRRLAVSSLTSAAHNKPHLVRDHLGTLQPLLYEQAKPDPSLVHEVVMGPFKVKVDDGLNIRKAAFQCMYTLLETCLNKLDITSYLDHVIAGLADDDDIKVQCYLMLVKLSHVASTAVVQRLDSAAKPLDDVLKTKLKETAVKQEVEKLAEMQRSVLRTIVALLPLVNPTNTPRFTQLVQEVRSGSLYGGEFKELVANAEHQRTSVGSDRMELD